MRRKFGKIIFDLAKKDKKIFLIVGDIGYGIFDDFREKFPDRFYNLEFVNKASLVLLVWLWKVLNPGYIQSPLF